MSRKVGWNTKHGQELSYVMLGILGEYLLFGKPCFASLNCSEEIAQVGARLSDQTQIPSVAVPRVNRRYPRLGELFKFVESGQPALQMALLQA